jgi:D-sedoheptulose 7-phosphate isomerase
MVNKVELELAESIDVKQKLLESSIATAGIHIAVLVLTKAFKDGNALYLIGNGGSAADAQHIAAELVGRFNKWRSPLPATALTTDTSVLTALSNDYDFDRCFNRQIEAHVNKGDVVIGLSTSGNSENIINGITEAQDKGAYTISLMGESGKLEGFADLDIMVPSRNSARIQECHITIGHIICSMVEEGIMKGNK